MSSSPAKMPTANRAPLSPPAAHTWPAIPIPAAANSARCRSACAQLLDRGCDAAMITPVDCPPLAPASLALLRESFERARTGDLWAVAPENNGHHGHPLLVSRDLIDVLLDAPVTGQRARSPPRPRRIASYTSTVPDDRSRAGTQHARGIRLLHRRIRPAQTQILTLSKPACCQQRTQRIHRQMARVRRRFRQSAHRAHQLFPAQLRASSIVFPLTSSVSAEPHAIAATQPLARNRISSIRPLAQS